MAMLEDNEAEKGERGEEAMQKRKREKESSVPTHQSPCFENQALSPACGDQTLLIKLGLQLPPCNP